MKRKMSGIALVLSLNLSAIGCGEEKSNQIIAAPPAIVNNTAPDHIEAVSNESESIATESPATIVEVKAEIAALTEELAQIIAQESKDSGITPEHREALADIEDHVAAEAKVIAQISTEEAQGNLNPETLEYLENLKISMGDESEQIDGFISSEYESGPSSPEAHAALTQVQDHFAEISSALAQIIAHNENNEAIIDHSVLPQRLPRSGTFREALLKNLVLPSSPTHESVGEAFEGNS